MLFESSRIDARSAELPSGVLPIVLTRGINSATAVSYGSPGPGRLAPRRRLGGAGGRGGILRYDPRERAADAWAEGCDAFAGQTKASLGCLSSEWFILSARAQRRALNTGPFPTTIP